jgi:predicted neutral ceramidase superfamily lipid hydrolase
MKTARIILTAGLVAGVLDGLAAAIQAYLLRGTSPVVVFQFIASGLLGREAFDGGLLTALAGLVLHLAIATSWAAVYFMAHRRLAFVRRRQSATVIGFGLSIWCVMNLAVVPLSRIPPRPFSITSALIGAAILIVMVAWPIAHIVGRGLKDGSGNGSPDLGTGGAHG